MASDTVNVIAQDALLLGVCVILAWKLDTNAFADLLGLVLIGARTGVKLGALDKLMPSPAE